jgi:hypothetical protein
MSYLSVRLEGNILTDDILQSIGQGEAQYQTDKYFGDASKDVQREIINSWSSIKSFYQQYKLQKERVGETGTGVSETRTFWINPLLHILGYQLVLSPAEYINDKSYAISHRDERLDGFPVLITGFNQRLDEKPKTGLRISPHALMQDYLNVKEDHIYGIVTNGDELRLLRDSSLMTRLSHVTFDLVRMMEEDLFSDFQLMYRLLHASRMPQDIKSGTESILEKYHEESLASGSRIREKLSEAVEQCLLILGTAFLSEPQNIALREWTTTQPDAPTEYYDWLLKLIYRMLFLLVIEERDLIYPDEYKKNDALREKRRIYYQYYSLQRLRKLADKRRYASERHSDLWEQILATFLIFDAGDHGKALGIKPLAGDLFSGSAIGEFNSCRLNNKILLECIRLLNHFENKRGQMIRVNYASLDVEEFGSVYEGLLEYAPVIDTLRWSFSFREGSGRSISGSHYTPDELVQPLIKHSLDHLIADRTVPLNSNEEKKRETIQKILALSVCDVACGSGHILLAAARRIGLEVARLRTGEQQPNLISARIGTRDAIRHCIYGVDKNPLAVTLCKVALWLEAHSPGEPLNFLDHKIKCGDSIVGLAHFDELQDGINEAAFAKMQTDDPDILKELRKENRKGKEGYEKILKSGHEILNKFRIRTDEYEVVLSMPERTPQEIEAKKSAYKKYTSGPGYQRLRMFADILLAPYFISKNPETKKFIPTNIDFYQMVSGYQSFQNPKTAYCTGISYERRFFHWFLEYPEVFAVGGFDCVLGNPPFLGGQKISTITSPNYLHFIHMTYAPAKGTTDLVAYFFRRIFSLIKDNGFQSLISTNTIAQGDTREGGLVVIRDLGGTINHAIRSMRWPGLAAVEVAMVSIFKGQWKGKVILDFHQVEKITSYLDDQDFIGDPFPLQKNANKSFVGSYVLGKGFILQPEEAHYLIEKNDKNKNVIFPYLNGEDLNNQVDQKPTRWVINFFDWPERRYTNAEWFNLSTGVKKIIQDRLAGGKAVEIAPPEYEGSVATDYPDCYIILEREVKPVREALVKDKIAKGKIPTNDDRNAAGTWWQFLRLRPALYRMIAGTERAMVTSRVTKDLVFSLTDKGTIYSEQTVVFAIEDFSDFAVVQSQFKNDWSWKRSSRMGDSTLRYSSSLCFDTFPFPQTRSINVEDWLIKIGTAYLNFRKKLCLDIQLGLTKTYNQYHNAQLINDFNTFFSKNTYFTDSQLGKKLGKETWNLYKHLQDTKDSISLKEAIERIEEMRRLHQEMDEAVLTAYGWHIDTERWGPTIQLRHDFYEVDYLPENDRIRYTIHPDARKEVLKRLLLLNHEIHEAEERGITWEQLNEEKIIALLKKKVEKWLPRTDRLLDGSLKSLCAGEDLLPSLHTATVQSYNAFVVQYSSAIEYELQHKIFIPFNEQFQKQHPEEKEKKSYLASQIAADSKNVVRKFALMLLKSDTKYTMGDMNFILKLIYNPSGNTLAACSVLQDLRTFVLSRYNDVILTKDFLHRLDTFIKTFRNEAAHTGMVSREDAMRCRDEVRGILGVMVEGEK